MVSSTEAIDDAVGPALARCPPYGVFSPVRLQGRNIRRGLPCPRFCHRPSCSLAAIEISRSVPGPDVLVSASVRTVFRSTQRPSLRSGLFGPGPSTLMRPDPPHSWAPPDFAALRFIPDALAVRFRLGDPWVVRAFALSLPSPHAVLYDHGKFISCILSVPSPLTLAFAKSLTARHSRNPHHPFPMGGWFHGFTGSLFRCFPQVAGTAIASVGGRCWVRLGQILPSQVRLSSPTPSSTS